MDLVRKNYLMVKFMKEILIWVKDQVKVNSFYLMVYLKDNFIIIKWLKENINLKMDVDIKDKFQKWKCKDKENFGIPMVNIIKVIYYFI